MGGRTDFVDGALRDWRKWNEALLNPQKRLLVVLAKKSRSDLNWMELELNKTEFGLACFCQSVYNYELKLNAEHSKSEQW